MTNIWVPKELRDQIASKTNWRMNTLASVIGEAFDFWLKHRGEMENETTIQTIHQDTE